jgi:G3E family GTPase
MSASLPESLSESRLPVTVITGFLGSGKTTLVKHILTNQEGLRTAVIVNELSEIGIDSELIVSATDDMVELENGCICCSINNDFLAFSTGASITWSWKRAASRIRCRWC